MKKSLLSRIAEAVTADPLPEVYVCKIATSYHTENIAKILELNAAYKVPPEKVMDRLRNKVVFKYATSWIKVQLDPTPNDTFKDSVTLIYKGSPVGYVRPDDQELVQKLISVGCVAAVRYFDGPYRIVDKKGECITTDNSFSGELVIIKK